MPRSQKGHWYILCIIDVVTNYLTAAPLYQASSEEVGEDKFTFDIPCISLNNFNLYVQGFSSRYNA